MDPLSDLELTRAESEARRIIIDEERAKTANSERDLRVCREHLAKTQALLEAAYVHSGLVDHLRSQVADLTAQTSLPRRVKLPPERTSVTHHLMIGDSDLYLIVGMLPSGEVGEVFLRLARQGSEASGWADQFAQTFSHLLQLGVPLEDLAKRFIGSRFEPSGFTNVAAIRTTTSPVDLVARVLLHRYVEKKPLTE